MTSPQSTTQDVSDEREAHPASGSRRYSEVPRILLTGAPRAGKTTLVSQIVKELQGSGIVVAGFTTRELRERGERTGFQVEAIGDGSAIMAHVAFTEGPRVGRYRVDVPVFERIALPALEQAIRSGGVAVIDELGRMELYSSAFVQAVQHLFAEDVPLVATVHAKAHPGTDPLKRHPGVELLTVTRATHEELLARVTARMLGALAKGRSLQPSQGSHPGS